MKRKYKIDQKYIHDYENQFVEEISLRSQQCEYFIDAIQKYSKLKNKNILSIGAGLGTMEFKIKKNFKIRKLDFFEPNESVKYYSKKIFDFKKRIVLKI